MARSLVLALILFGLVVGLAGCDRSATIRTEETVTGPGGTTTTTVEKTVESTGDNPPASTSGERVTP